MIRSTRLSLALGIATISVLGSASVAHAQYQAPPPGYNAPPPGYGYGYPPPPPPPERVWRSGLTLGGGLGVGRISASNCANCGGGGFAWELHIGGMVTPQLAIMGDVSGIARSVDDGFGGSNTLSNYLFAVAAQYWVVPRFWLKGGLGDAVIDLTDSAGNSYGGGESAVGVLLAGGVELVSASTFALDLQLRFMHGAYSGGGASNLGLLIGFNWY